MLGSPSPNTVHKSKSYKKPYYNKKKLKSHPYLEYIQKEISTLEDDLHQLEELEKEGELTSEQTLDKQIKNACLERYQATLDKLMESSMSSKVRSFQDMESRNKEEQQTLFLLQFFYLVRLGQLGLFEYIDTASSSSLKAMTDVCDQLVGAAVYCAVDPKLKTQKRSHVFSTLKKLEVGSDDEICDKVTFKDLKELMQHIWDHTVTETKDEGQYAVLPFDSMVGKHEDKSSNDEKSEEQSGWNKAIENDKDTKSAAVENDKAPEEEEKKSATAENDKVPEEDTKSGWNEVVPQNDKLSEGWSTVAQNGKENSSWSDTVQNGTKPHDTTAWNSSPIENEKPKHSGWDVIPNEVKSDTWGDKQVTSSSPSIEEEHEEEVKSNSSESTDNWRNRDSSRGRGIRGRGRGNKLRGRGRGAPRGRGRGKGRHEDSPLPQHE